MSYTTKIEWADATFNPWIGCTKVSAGCKNCYAEQTTRARVLRSHGQETWGKGAARSRTSATTWKQPLLWQKRHNDCGEDGQRLRVFPSLCDWLDGEVPIDWLADFLRLIYETPNLDWLLLTKRPENFIPRLHDVQGRAKDGSEIMRFTQKWLRGGAPSNVWLGVSAENQAMADLRIPQLMDMPAVVHFLSLEPLLELVSVNYAAYNGGDSFSGMSGIDWVIVGGESGPKARACNLRWLRWVVAECRNARVPCSVKQLGKLPGWSGEDVKEKWYERFSDPKGGNIDEWPKDLRVREFPTVKRR